MIVIKEMKFPEFITLDNEEENEDEDRILARLKLDLEEIILIDYVPNILKGYYTEYQLLSPLWLKDHPEYKQDIGTISPSSYDKEGQAPLWDPNCFDKLDEYGEEFNWKAEL